MLGGFIISEKLSGSIDEEKIKIWEETYTYKCPICGYIYKEKIRKRTPTSCEFAFEYVSTYQVLNTEVIERDEPFLTFSVSSPSNHSIIHDSICKYLLICPKCGVALHPKVVKITTKE